METKIFVNYYEMLELGPGAGSQAIARKFRSLARRYHPDNQITGSRIKFDSLVEAHDTLKDAGKRAQYHEQHSDKLPPLPDSLDQDWDGLEKPEAPHTHFHVEPEKFVDDLGVDRDISIQNNLLTMLYFQRRRNARQPGIGNAELERLSGCPHEHLEFHLWYLKAKGWVSTGDDGLLAITVAGVDRAAQIHQGENSQKLIVDRS